MATPATTNAVSAQTMAMAGRKKPAPPREQLTQAPHHSAGGKAKPAAPKCCCLRLLGWATRRRIRANAHRHADSEQYDADGQEHVVKVADEAEIFFARRRRRRAHRAGGEKIIKRGNLIWPQQASSCG
ncbi:MAG: hypothetical protein NVV62_10280 [Terricaulis sp.]|nr:hypothetical protein [Terricaulis sp.]